MIYSDPMWDQITSTDLNGVLMIIGGSDTGKTTFARYLFKRLKIENPEKTILFLDGDPGQGILGPPTTITLSDNLVNINSNYQQVFTKRYFIGSISPRGHMLQMIVGTSKLLSQIPDFEKTIVIHDTNGLVEPGLGGCALKTAMIELVQPSTLFIFQRGEELSNLIRPYKLSGRVKLFDLSVSNHVSTRDREERKQNRQRKYKEYFSKVHNYEIDWKKIATIPYPPDFGIQSLIALEDQYGFTLGLGIINSFDRKRSSINASSPLSSFEKIKSLRFGDVSLDPETFMDKLVFTYG